MGFNPTVITGPVQPPDLNSGEDFLSGRKPDTRALDLQVMIRGRDIDSTLANLFCINAVRDSQGSHRPENLRQQIRTLGGIINTSYRGGQAGRKTVHQPWQCVHSSR